MPRRDGFADLEQVRAAAGHVPEVAQLLANIDRWVEHGSTRPLEVYLALPSTAAARRRYRRDKALLRAAAALRDTSPDIHGPFTGCACLEDHLRAFQTRGCWRVWREAGAPPEDASDLRRALFWALFFNGGQALGLRSLQRIVGHVFSEKCPMVAPTLHASSPEESI